MKRFWSTCSCSFSPWHALSGTAFDLPWANEAEMLLKLFPFSIPRSKFVGWKLQDTPIISKSSSIVPRPFSKISSWIFARFSFVLGVGKWSSEKWAFPKRGKYSYTCGLLMAASLQVVCVITVSSASFSSGKQNSMEAGCSFVSAITNNDKQRRSTAKQRHTTWQHYRSWWYRSADWCLRVVSSGF